LDHLGKSHFLLWLQCKVKKLEISAPVERDFTGRTRGENDVSKMGGSISTSIKIT